ncbi:MAG: 30S ribosomal protein S17 [Deltaproteobacteria bacterium]|nr:30S ribosomal protein S17 [Deltaproteobacteria bacterium]MBI4374804.1 30S ribosomal protein S17 [Deltaproteobacteria bacterium]
MSRRTKVAHVLSHRMKKTAIAVVKRRTSDPRTGKVVSTQKKFKVHDERDETGEGDEILIEECRPLSREKRWRIKKVIKKAYADLGGKAA